MNGGVQIGGGRTKTRSLKSTLLIFMAAGVIEIAFSLASAAILRNSGGIIASLGGKLAPGEPLVSTLAEIFGALQTAQIVPNPFLPGILLLAGFWLASCLLRNRNGWKICLAVLLLLLIMAGAFVLTLWLTDVNGIRFGTVVRSLLGYLKSGALDSLALAKGEVLL